MSHLQPSSPLVIITGRSGAGKGTLLRALEDRGYFCVDNLPVGLLKKFAELLLKSDGDVRRAALVVDVREGEGLDRFPRIFEQIRKTPGLDVWLYFLEASDDVLIRRFSETRRPHPINPSLPVREAIALEGQRLGRIRAMADHIVDTSEFSIHQLRSHADRLFAESAAGPFLVTLVSFGYKYGVPVDVDMVFDCRFLPNPHFVPDLKPLTGADPAVVEYIRSQPVTGEFLRHIESMLDFLLPQFRTEGKSYLTIGIGCTGGRHRSVMITNALAEHLADRTPRLQVIHRDVEK